MALFAVQMCKRCRWISLASRGTQRKSLIERGKISGREFDIERTDGLG